MKCKSLVAVTSVVALATLASAAGCSAEPQASGPPQTLFTGVMLGMTPAEVVSAVPAARQTRPEPSLDGRAVELLEARLVVRPGVQVRESFLFSDGRLNIIEVGTKEMREVTSAAVDAMMEQMSARLGKPTCEPGRKLGRSCDWLKGELAGTLSTLETEGRGGHAVFTLQYANDLNAFRARHQRKSEDPPPG